MPDLYGHPFAAFVWKPLIACYERNVAFTFRMIDEDHPENVRRLAELSPTGQMPALVDGDREVTGSNAVIEYLDLHHGTAPRLIPDDRDEAARARMMADLLDDYIAMPMQRIVAEAFRSLDEADPRGVAEARVTLDRTYRWLDDKIAAGPWATGAYFTNADCAAAPALFYADWVHPIPAEQANLTGYRARLLARPSVARVIDEARPYRALFPLGAPARD